MSDPGSQQVHQGRARPCSCLAVGSRSEQIRSGPLGTSGVEKCMGLCRAPGYGNVTAQKEWVFREWIKLASPIHTLYQSLIYRGSNFLCCIRPCLCLTLFSLAVHLTFAQNRWQWTFRVLHQGHLCKALFVMGWWFRMLPFPPCLLENVLLYRWHNANLLSILQIWKATRDIYSASKGKGMRDQSALHKGQEQL